MKHVLMKDPFGRYVARIYHEWHQTMDEGRMVEQYQSECRALQESYNDADSYGKTQSDARAEALGRLLTTAPVRPDYPYVEPSDYDGILAQRKDADANAALFDTLPEQQLYDKIKGCWLGRVAGCLLGKPLEFMRRDQIVAMLQQTNNYPAARYTATTEFTPDMIRQLQLRTDVPEQPWIDEIGEGAPIDDDTNYTVFNLKLLETFGPAFESNDVLYAWINWMPAGITATAERVAYTNACQGILAPRSALYRNPYREWVGAQIRAEVFGMINPGNPVEAARMAFVDASASHVKNGIYGEMMTAAMVAAAMVCDDVEAIVQAGLREIPARSRLYEAASQVLGWHAEGLSYEMMAQRIHDRYDEDNLHHWCHTIPNAMFVIAALLLGEKDFTKTVGYAVSQGFDTDSNGAVASAIVGAMLGFNAIPAYWGETFGYKMHSSVTGYECATLDTLAHNTLAVQKGKIEVDTKIKSRYDYNENFTEKE